MNNNAIEIRFRTLPEDSWSHASRIGEWLEDWVQNIKEGMEETGSLPPPTLIFLAPTSDGEDYRECMVDIHADNPEQFQEMCYETIPELLRDLRAIASLTVRPGVVGSQEYEIEATEEEAETVGTHSFVEVSSPEEVFSATEECEEIVSFLAESQMHHSFELYRVTREGEKVVLGDRLPELEGLEDQPTIFHHNKPKSQLN